MMIKKQNHNSVEGRERPILNLKAGSATILEIISRKKDQEKTLNSTLIPLDHPFIGHHLV